MYNSFIVETIANYIKDKSSNAGNSPVQFSIPILPYKRQVVMDILEAVKSEVRKSKVTIKVAKQAEEYWKKAEGDGKNVDSFFIKHPDWLDRKGNLTAYRNRIGTDELLIIVGADCVDDIASIEHILSCSPESIWQNVMKRSFSKWIECAIGFKDDNADALLKAIMQYSDLMNIDAFLISIIDEDTDDIAHEIGANLYKLGLQVIDTRKISKNKGFSEIVKFSFEYLNGDYALDSAASKNANKKINKLKIDYEDGKKDALFLDDCFEPFSNPAEYLDACLDAAFGRLFADDKQKLMRTDAYTLYSKVLKYKAKKSEKPQRKGDIQVSGTPLEAVLCALWKSFKEYLSDYWENGKGPKITNISIALSKVVYNTTEKFDDVPEVEQKDYVEGRFIKPFFGGLETLVSSVLDDVKNSGFGFISTDFRYDCRFFDYSDWTVSFSPVSMNSVVFRVGFDILGEEGILNNFKLQIPSGHPLAYSLAFVGQQAKAISSRINSPIPVFLMDKYADFSRKSDDEADSFFEREALNNTDVPPENVMKNLVEDVRLYNNSNLEIQLNILARAYAEYAESFQVNGFYAAIDKKSEGFFSAYSGLLDYIAKDKKIQDSHSTLCQYLLRAFWVIDSAKVRNSELDSNPRNSFQSGILTILHPAVAEMAKAQINYQTDQFVPSLKDFSNGKNIKQMDQVWDFMMDYSKMNPPIPCAGNEIARATGSGYLFNIGYLDTRDNIEPSSVTENYSFDDDEDISISDLTRMGDESMLLHRLFSDYFHSHAFAYDGVRIAILMPVNIQAVMSSVIYMISHIVFEPKREKTEALVPFRLNIDFYSTPEDEGRICQWISKLQEYWKDKSLVDEQFAQTSLSVGYRMMRSINDIKFSEGATDIVILYESKNASIWHSADKYTSTLKDIAPIQHNTVTPKFPMVEKLLPKKSSPMIRWRLISNRQFNACSSYLRFSKAVLYSVPVNPDQQDVVVQEEFDFSNWLELFDKCISNCERVITIGSEMDRELILSSPGSRNSGDNPTVIVGFGSGIGANANLNYAVSSKLLKKEDMIGRLCDSFSTMYGNAISPSDCRPIVEQLYADSNRMADLSLVKAFGCHSFYSHDFFGYAMIRHLLSAKESFCDILISLDSYRHWFKSAEGKIRADLLWLVADIKDLPEANTKIFSLKASVVESKVGLNIIDNYLQHAAVQVISTYDYLKSKFKPISDTYIDYDQKYWWMQLHRLISANTRVEDEYYTDCITALENLAEGIFEIEWDKHIYGFDRVIGGKHRQIKLMGEEEVCADIYYPDEVFSIMEKTGPVNMNNVPSSDIQEIEIDRRQAEKQEKKQVYEREKELHGEIPDDIENSDDETTDSDEEFNDISVFVDGFSTPLAEEVPDNGDSASSSYKTEVGDDDIHESQRILEIPVTSRESINVDTLRIPLGKTAAGREIFWDYGPALGLQNRHMIILGSSGSGKSYAIKMILAELARAKQPSLILDYTEGFTPEGLADIAKWVREQKELISSQLELNPFAEHGLKNPYLIADRVAGVFARIWKGLGSRQKTVLQDSIEEGLKRGGVFTFNDLLDILNEKYADKTNIDRNNAGTCASHIKPLCKINPFCPPSSDYSFWDGVFDVSDNDEQINVIQLKSIPREVSLAIIEFVLWDLYYHLVAIHSTEFTPHPIVLDEIQNLNLTLDSPVGKYFTEGRKHGISLIAATQSVSVIGGKSSSAMSILTNAATIMFFRPVPNEMKSVGEVVANLDNRKTRDEWAEQLSGLAKGHCLVYQAGKGNSRVEEITVTSLEARGLDK